MPWNVQPSLQHWPPLFQGSHTHGAASPSCSTEAVSITCAHGSPLLWVTSDSTWLSCLWDLQPPGMVGKSLVLVALELAPKLVPQLGSSIMTQMCIKAPPFFICFGVLGGLRGVWFGIFVYFVLFLFWWWWWWFDANEFSFNIPHTAEPHPSSSDSQASPWVAAISLWPFACHIFRRGRKFSFHVDPSFASAN